MVKRVGGSWRQSAAFRPGKVGLPRTNHRRANLPPRIYKSRDISSRQARTTSDSAPKNASFGARHPKRRRGRLFRLSSTARASSSEIVSNRRDFGKYYRISPFAFSSLPRCQEEYGSAK